MKMRTEECREKIDSAAKACNLEESTVREVKRAIGISDQFKGSFDEISSLATDTVLELGKKENKAVLDKVIPELKKRIATGARPTKREVKTLIQNATYEHTPPAPLPENKYDVILADPPWRYEFSETQSREIENQYPTMDLEDIKTLKAPAADNSILLLWTTAPKLEEGIAVMNAWGFKYRSCAIWDKERKGMGYWFRIQHELLLVGVKGEFHPPDPENRFDSVIRSPRAEHSRKPDCIYEMIESMFPHGTKIEMFARNNRPGWSSWGNEV
jgi:N6-adenosine-specific RNA methylase IME4